MKRINGNKGFSLIECVIALFLVSVVMLAMVSHVGVSMAALQTDKMTSVASSLLQDRAEALRQTPYLNVATGGDTIMKDGISYSRNWTVTSSGNMKTVALSIAWNGRTLNTSILVAQ